MSDTDTKKQPTQSQYPSELIDLPSEGKFIQKDIH